MFLPILALALSAPAPEAPDPPKGPAPKVMVLNVDKDGRGYLQASVTVTKFVPETRTTIVNGQMKVVQVQVPVTVTEQRQIALTDEGVTVFGPDGKKLDPKNLPKLTGAVAVLLSADGKEVDPFYLALARPGTLVIVAPGLASPPGPDLAPPPKP
jgi:hypothetical protein